MAGAHRNQKLHTYNVDVTRDVERRKTVQVQARSIEEAEDLVRDVEFPEEEYIEHVVAVTIKAKLDRSKA